ncbi:hypothetical protein ACTHPH_02640 [Paenibacillus pasadenensis]|uniref:Uncharacterized protein n=1 Tax=Paenibacillus pasadenensis TaxID=217090 RepID=A0A2N5N6U0_9BACL|nr:MULTISPECIES: hypothetical protein [Paenibacillus]PLT46067.1 hypothetical protein B8V81_4498 [Paenibacillus pasadenensis]QGG56544.1 hypothetical protein GE073_13780 [Paenibacillus sp. B01]
MIRFNAVWVAGPGMLDRYIRECTLSERQRDPLFPRMRLLLRKVPIPFEAFGQLTLSEKELEFEALRPTFSSVAVFQFYGLNRSLTFRFRYSELYVSPLPPLRDQPLPTWGDWVRLTSRSSSVEYVLAASSTGARLYPWLASRIAPLPGSR